jgi:Cd2+/Zn2+-exporting ATPase
MRAAGAFQDSRLARILKLVEEAASRKSKVERFISQFARYYTPAVFALAVVTAVAPPLWGQGDFAQWLYRGLVLLVISCPCALVISIPLSYFAGIGAAARLGILVKGGHVLDALKQVRAVAFDKTGTLTQGGLRVLAISAAPAVSQAELLQSALLALAASNHPLARALAAHAADLGMAPPPLEALSSREQPGRGVETRLASGDQCYLAGNLAWMEENNIAAVPNPEPASVVYAAVAGRFMGSIAFSDRIKDDAASALANLRSLGIKTYMLTGDGEKSAAWVAGQLRLDGYRAGLLPADKAAALEELAGLDNSMFVGDGVNDAPVLAAARVSVAMGGLGSAAAIEIADAAIINDSPSKVVNLFAIGRRTRAVAWQNIALALGVKLVFMGLGICGLAGLWEAVFADVGVALLAVLNATRGLGARN